MSVRAFDSCRLTIGRGLLYARIDNPFLIVIPLRNIYIFISVCYFVIIIVKMNNLYPSLLMINRKEFEKKIYIYYRDLFELFTSRCISKEERLYSKSFNFVEMEGN